MPNPNYPIALRKVVPAKSNVFESMRVRLKEIPSERSDYAVVLEFNGHHELVPNGTPLERADGVRSASGIVFIDIREVDIDIEVEMKTRGHVETRPVRASFRAQVQSPVHAAQTRVSDLGSKLETWLTSVLSLTSQAYSTDEVGLFETEAAPLAGRTLREQPPISETAVQITLLNLEADLPTSEAEARESILGIQRTTRVEVEAARGKHLVAGQVAQFDHEQSLQTTEHDHERWSAGSKQRDALREHEWAEAGRIEEAFKRGPQALGALHAARNPAALGELINQALGERQMTVQVWLNAVENMDLPESLKLDLVTAIAQEIMPAGHGSLDTGSGSLGKARGLATSDRPNSNPQDDSFDITDDSFDDRRVDTPDDLLLSVLNEDETEADPMEPQNGGEPTPDAQSSVARGDNGLVADGQPTDE